MGDMKTKICTKCGEEFLATTDYFYRQKGGKFGLSSWCKDCRNKWRRQHYIDNREKELEQQREYYRENRYKELKRVKKYDRTEAGKECRRGRDKKQYNKNKLSRRISKMIWKALKGNKASRHWETLVPYTLEELKQHLECLFQPGMSWENHTFDGWHIDHKIPMSVFNITSCGCEDFKMCWALENLQPLWAEENLRKSNKILGGKEATCYDK